MSVDAENTIARLEMQIALDTAVALVASSVLVWLVGHLWGGRAFLCICGYA